MRTKYEVVTFVYLGLVCGVAVCLGLLCYMACPKSADTGSRADVGSEKTRAHSSEKRKRVDLGDGTILTEYVVKSERGEVRGRGCDVACDGKAAVRSLWNSTGTGNSGPIFSRSYYQNRTLVWHEGYKNGIPDVLFLCDEQGLVQAFADERDGMLVPWSKDRMQQFENQFRLMSEIMRPIIQGAKDGVSEEKFEGLLEDAVKRAKEGASSESADTDGRADVDPRITRAEISRKTNCVDLAGGVSLTEFVDRSERGEVRHRACTIARDGKPVLISIWSRTGIPNGGPTLMRRYFHNGTLVFGEDYKDGVPDAIALCDERGVPIQVFADKHDGTLVPWSKDRVQQVKNQYRLMSEIMRPIIQGAKDGVSDEKFQGLLQDAINRASEGFEQE